MSESRTLQQDIGAATPKTDLAHDVLRTHRQPLKAIFTPKTIAVVGATERTGSVGRTVLGNLLNNTFGGEVFPVNPTRPTVLGAKTYPSLRDIPKPVDLAVIVTPAATVPDIIGQCADIGVPGAIVISAGFKELGPPGVELERKVLEQARRGSVRLIGPNCLGVMNPVYGLNATFARHMARPGNVAFLSQSGALLTGILDWSLKEQVGFSAFVSTGSMLDISWGDLIDYFGDDPTTRAILIYMEGIGDARSFLSAAREVALTTPIIVLKPGRTGEAAKAAASHTGSLTGGDDVLDAAFRRCGVLRVNTIAELFYMAEVLGKQPRPRGPRLTMITNAGGPGVLATDALIDSGGKLAAVAPDVVEQLNGFLPSAWSRSNPIDILGDADADRYARTLEVVAKDPESDGLLVMLTPQDMSEPGRTAELLQQYARIGEPFPKPVLASWMGGQDVQAGEEILSRSGIPTFPYPDTAARMFSYMWRYTYNLHGLYETPAMQPDSAAGTPDRAAAEKMLAAVRGAGRSLLTEEESKSLLAAYRIPTVPTHVAATADLAVRAADQFGYPVVLKLHSTSITHKTDVGGVKLNLPNQAAVRQAFAEIRQGVLAAAGSDAFRGVTVQPMIRREDAYELIIGSSIDPQFGPVLLFGTGGQLVEVFKDRSLALPPLNATLARRMIEQTKIFKALQGVRGRKAVDLPALEQLLVRFAQLVVERPWIKEIDINPLLASADRLVALDARVVLHDPHTTEDHLPKPAIRPYPLQYVWSWKTKDGVPLTIRPIRPEDEPLLVEFHRTLSERTVRLRYFAPLKLDLRTTHERLIRVCFNDYDRELALVVERQDPHTRQRQIVAIGRLSRIRNRNEAELAVLVSDLMQNRGIGTELTRCLVSVARQENLARVTANLLPENLEMRRVFEKAGFRLAGEIGEPTLRAELRLA
jgi:acetyltransferase